jgi:hypothetical protein
VNEFSYIDIFATKGFEYLLVIGFFLLLVGFWSFLNVPKKEIRKAQAEREELRRLLAIQRERMDTELQRLRDQREDMQNALLAQLRPVENRALAAWNDAHPDREAPPDPGKLFDWVLTERDQLAEDKKRLDYLTYLVQWEPRLHRKPEPEGGVRVDIGARGSAEGLTLREAIDQARRRHREA